MGYDIHITRAEDWFEDEQPITLEEIEAIWDKLPKGFEIDRSGVVTTTTPNGMTLSAKVKPYLIYQDGEDKQSRIHVYFDNGTPTFRVRSEEKLLPMIELAELLGAKVQGDECEVYTKDGIIS